MWYMDLKFTLKFSMFWSRGKSLSGYINCNGGDNKGNLNIKHILNQENGCGARDMSQYNFIVVTIM